MEEEDIDDDEKGEEEIQYRCVDVTEFSERALERGKMESDRMIEEQFGRLDENSSSSSASFHAETIWMRFFDLPTQTEKKETKNTKNISRDPHTETSSLRFETMLPVKSYLWPKTQTEGIKPLRTRNELTA